MRTMHLYTALGKVACGRQWIDSSTLRFLPEYITCKDCKKTKEYKETVLNIELKFDGNVEHWLSYLTTLRRK